jgi:poly(A) polymerase
MDVAPAAKLEDAEWLRHEAPRRIIETLAVAGFTARAVGGCVRDALLGRPIGDIDLATDARPETVDKVLREAGIKVVPTGLSHGTVTAVIGGVPVEVTTLRTDVETDGRHARVAFTEDWWADAMRRDFTLNALYADLDGAIYDPAGGLEDIKARHIRFIGRPEDRIAEDALRILRFFRFYAWFGAPPPDEPALAACAAMRGNLAILSAERISAEVMKLLAAPDPLPSLRAMAATGVTGEIFARHTDMAALARLVAVERALGRPQSLRRLAAWLPGDAARMTALAAQLRLSGKEKARLHEMAPRQPVPSLEMDEAGLRRRLYEWGRACLIDRLILAMAQAESPRPALLAAAETLPIPELPIKGRDIVALGIPPGPKVSAILKDFEDWWVKEGFPEGMEARKVRELVALHRR